MNDWCLVATGGLLLTDDQDAVRLCVAGRSAPHYVYILRRPDGTPFYVGKGTGNRCLSHPREASNTSVRNYKLNIIRSLRRNGERVQYEFDSFFSEEASAFTRERELIRTIGRFDLGCGPLANCTEGGEGTCNPSEESKRRAMDKWCGSGADTEWAACNRFFKQLYSEGAVSLKPAATQRIEVLTPHPQRRSFTLRQAATLVASAAANDVLLEERGLIPRWMTIDGMPFVIENGAGRDILKSEMARLSLESTRTREIFELTPLGYSYIIQSFSGRLLKTLGVLEPEMSPQAVRATA